MACGVNTLVDKAHIRSRGAGGSNEWDNILLLCRECHQFQHKEGWPAFARKYPDIVYDLDVRGWEIRSLGGLHVPRLMRKNSSGE